MAENTGVVLFIKHGRKWEKSGADYDKRHVALKNLRTFARECFPGKPFQLRTESGEIIN